MKLDSVKRIVTGKQKGAFSSMLWERPMKLKKAFAGNVVTKRSKGTVRFGVEYDNMKAVQEKREGGVLPEKNAGLPWGEWSAYPYLISHKGNSYLRTSKVPGSKIETEYFLNGRKVEKKDVEAMCLKSEFSGNEADCFNVNVENILSIK